MNEHFFACEGRAVLFLLPSPGIKCMKLDTGAKMLVKQLKKKSHQEYTLVVNVVLGPVNTVPTSRAQVKWHTKINGSL